MADERDIAVEMDKKFMEVCNQVCALASLPDMPPVDWNTAYQVIRDVLVEQELPEEARILLTGLAAACVKNAAKETIVVAATA